MGFRLKLGFQLKVGSFCWLKYQWVVVRKVLGVVILFWVLWVAICRDYGSWGLWLWVVVLVAMAVAMVVVVVAMVVVVDDYCDVYFIGVNAHLVPTFWFFPFWSIHFNLPLLVPKPISACHISPCHQPTNRKSWHGWRHY